MFKKIFIENSLREDPITLKILNKLNNEIPKFYINSYTDVFEKVKKPYLQKQNNLSLFIAKKKGELVKIAPEAYGFSKNPHYYFFHSLNCIYECEYCYLQGYFNSPDIVYFINFIDVGNEIKKLSLQASSEKPYWFHMGEFSDSLALSYLSDDISYYFNLFKKLKNCFLEFRTKSVNIKNILKNSPLPNVVTSFTLGPNSLKDIEKKVPSALHRILAMQKLYNRKFKLGLHLDPIIYHTNFVLNYTLLIKSLAEHLPLSYFEYISIGVIRFSKDSYRQLLSNYPESDCLSHEFIKSFDGKVRYPRAIRQEILKQIREILIKSGASGEKIYLCME